MLRQGGGACRVVLRLNAITSRPTVLSSGVLALALLGDSLLYAVLPLHAATFGVSMAWVGVLLSANRLIRLFVYPLLARAAGLAGLRRFTIAAATLGGVSTLSFAGATGAWPLLAARMAWGIAFGSLSLATLAYATALPDGAGARVGLSLSLRELGPIASLTAGMLLVTLQGVRPTLALLGAASMLAVPLAMLLPDPRSVGVPPADAAGVSPAAGAARRCHHQPARTPALRIAAVSVHERLSAAVGLLADGIFPATIALLLAPSAGVSGAAIAAGTLLAGKRVAVVVLGPVSGRAADRFGAGSTTMTGVVLIASGAFLIASGGVVAGSVLLLAGAAVTSTSLPLTAPADAREHLSGLARLATARDAGAAAGPLLAMSIFDFTGATVLYVAAGVLVLGAAATLGNNQRAV